MSIKEVEIATSRGSKPTAVTTRVFAVGGTEMEKFPESDVAVPMLDPLTVTEAETAAPLSSVTFPLIFLSWEKARTEKENRHTYMPASRNSVFIKASCLVRKFVKKFRIQKYNANVPENNLMLHPDYNQFNYHIDNQGY
jgi:hypothetical protein